MAALAEEPAAFSLNAVAKAAGVGIGTLYRHFPTREALLVEVYRVEREQLVASADELLATEKPYDALVQWIDRLTTAGRAKLGFGDALADLGSYDELVRESHAPIVGALTRLLAANEKAKTLRPGLDPDDLLRLLSALWRVPPTPDGDAQAERMRDLLLGGLSLQEGEG